MRKFLFDIDISGACNLRCPSCPQGNVKNYHLPHGFMEPELLEHIMEKAVAECLVDQVSLYNWAEPLFHPRLPELVNIVQAQGVPCHLSSNLNILPDVEAILTENPASFRISTSGFSQEIYSRTHRGGDIEKVKKHMLELVKAKQRSQADTDIYVYYHRYLHNLEDEPKMRDYAAELGIQFIPDWALMLPLEKILGFLEGVDSYLPLTEEDHQLINSLALPLRDALLAARKYADRACPLRDEAITLDYRGNVMLCCGVFDARKYTLGNFIDMPLEEIQRIRNNHPMCKRCMQQGAHIYLTYGIDEMNELALANIPPNDIELLKYLRYEISWRQRRQRLAKLYDRFFPGLLSNGQKKILSDGFTRAQNYLRQVRRKPQSKG